MVDNLALHPSTRDKIESYLKTPTTGLLLLGPAGSGKRALSLAIAQKLGTSPIQKMLDHGELLILGDDEIGIGDVRSLIKKLSIKPRAERINFRIVLVHNAERLGHEAQNALLKTLEQPQSSAYFIFSASSSSAILPTVLSRLALLNINPISLDMALEFYAKNHPAKQIQEAWLISSGNAGQLNNLLSETSDEKTYINTAKKFVAAKRYDRLIMSNNIAANKEEFEKFLWSLATVLKALQHSQIDKDQLTTAKRIVYSRKLVSEVRSAIAQNGSIKLATLRLITALEV